MSELEIYTNTDGSKTLLNQSLNETYHSRHGAIAESMHVFIEKGLRHPMMQDKKNIRIFEMGFGTGLNAILSLTHQKANQPIYYHSIETLPLANDLVHQLGYTDLWNAEDKAYFLQIHEAVWNQEVRIRDGFVLKKEEIALEQIALPNGSIDLVYFDAFAPDKQPHLWSLAIFEKLFNAMDQQSILVTYSSKGEVKRHLKAVGFEVERLEGPPYKRHMLRAIKNQ